LLLLVSLFRVAYQNDIIDFSTSRESELFTVSRSIEVVDFSSGKSLSLLVQAKKFFTKLHIIKKGEGE